MTDREECGADVERPYEPFHFGKCMMPPGHDGPHHVWIRAEETPAEP